MSAMNVMKLYRIELIDDGRGVYTSTHGRIILTETEKMIDRHFNSKRTPPPYEEQGDLGVLWRNPMSGREMYKFAYKNMKMLRNWFGYRRIRAKLADAGFVCVEITIEHRHVVEGARQVAFLSHEVLDKTVIDRSEWV